MSGLTDAGDLLHSLLVLLVELVSEFQHLIIGTLLEVSDFSTKTSDQLIEPCNFVVLVFAELLQSEGIGFL